MVLSRTVACHALQTFRCIGAQGCCVPAPHTHVQSRCMLSRVRAARVHTWKGVVALGNAAESMYRFMARNMDESLEMKILINLDIHSLSLPSSFPSFCLPLSPWSRFRPSSCVSLVFSLLFPHLTANHHSGFRVLYRLLSYRSVTPLRLYSVQPRSSLCKVSFLPRIPAFQSSNISC